MKMIERVARAKAARHYAKRFGKPESDPHVQQNVEANWNIFEQDIRHTIGSMRKLPPEVLDAEGVHMNCPMCGGYEEGWHRLINEILK